MMLTALQVHTSVMVTPEFQVLSQKDFGAKYGDALSISYRGWDLTARLNYVQSLVDDGQMWDTSLWENIPAWDCAKNSSYQTDRSTLLIVVNERPEQIFSVQDPRLVPYRSPYYTNLLSGFLKYSLYPHHNTVESDCDSRSEWHTRILYCLSRKVPGRSRLQIALWPLCVATVLNVIKLVCFLATFKEQRGTPLSTTGDAVASFLGSPCPYYTGRCLLSQEELLSKLGKNASMTQRM